MADGRTKSLPDQELYIQQLPAEAPKHRVRITKPFYMGLCEVTQAQYESVMGINPSKFKGDANRPVERMTWDQASAFCRKLGELPGEQSAGAVYRLPTEAEWEYACRAGTTTSWYGTDYEAAVLQQAWIRANAGQTTHPVGQMAPNAWGLYDIQGNVFEWCQDWYSGDYYRQSPNVDPTGPPDGSERVCRGGCWYYGAGHCRSANRWRFGQGSDRDALGFRVVRTVSAE